MEKRIQRLKSIKVKIWASIIIAISSLLFSITLMFFTYRGMLPSWSKWTLVVLFFITIASDVIPKMLRKIMSPTRDSKNSRASVTKNVTIANKLVERRSATVASSLQLWFFVYILPPIWQIEIPALSEIALAMGALQVLAYLLFRLRLAAGVYGDTEHEAREILEFVIGNRDDGDFRGGNKIRIFAEGSAKEEGRSLVPGQEGVGL